MKVEVHLFATLTRYLPVGSAGDRVSLEVAEGTTVGELLRVLEIPEPFDCMRVVNGRDVPPDHRLAEGDSVSLFPPLAGGRGL